MISISEISSISEIEKTKWNEFVDRFGLSIFQRHEWLAAYEEAYPNHAVKSVHHLIGKNSTGEIIGLLPLFHILNCPYWLSIAEDIPHTSDIFQKPYLASQSWYAFYSDIIGDRKCDDYKIFVKKAVVKIEKICLRLHIPYSNFTAVSPDDPLYQLLAQEGYRPFDIMHNTVLELTAESYSEHIKNLSSSNARHNIKKYSKRLASAGIGKTWLMNLTLNEIERFHFLLVETYKRHGGAELAEPKYNLEAIFNNMPENAGLIVLKNESQWIAAALCYVHNHTFYACYPGMMMNDFLRPLNLRLNLYCACIEQAFKLGCNYVEFGRTGYEFKGKLGIKKHLTNTLIKAYGDGAEQIYDSFNELKERL